MALFLSTFENKVDKKGRVSVPASFRTTVATSHFQGVALYCHPQFQCLEGADISFLEQLSNRLYEDYGLFDADQLSVATTLLADSCQLAFDSEGRILLPASMRDFMGLDGSATFVGLGPRFQIWEPAAFAAHREEQRRLAADKISALPPFGRRGDPGGRS